VATRAENSLKNTVAVEQPTMSVFNDVIGLFGHEVLSLYCAPKVVGTAPNQADVEDGLNQVGNLESEVEPMPTFTSVNPAPCRVGPSQILSEWGKP